MDGPYNQEARGLLEKLNFEDVGFKGIGGTRKPDIVQRRGDELLIIETKTGKELKNDNVDSWNPDKEKGQTDIIESWRKVVREIRAEKQIEGPVLKWLVHIGQAIHYFEYLGIEWDALGVDRTKYTLIPALLFPPEKERLNFIQAFKEIGNRKRAFEESTKNKKLPISHSFLKLGDNHLLAKLIYA